MKAHPVLFTLALAATVALVGCDLLPKRSQGETLWREHCARCHGLNGSGDTPGYMGQAYADLLDDEWRAGGNDGAMEIVIEEGVFGKMPGYPQLNDEEVQALIEYIHVLRGERTPGTAS